MSFDYDNARAIATRVINKYGGAGQLIVAGNSSGYDRFGNSTPATPDSFLDAILTPPALYLSSEIDNSTIIKGDSWTYIQCDTEPKIGMQVTLNSNDFVVIDVTEVSSIDAINIYYKLQLRK